MFFPIEEKKAKEEASTSILLMSGGIAQFVGSQMAIE
jgi:hypothetical protein